MLKASDDEIREFFATTIFEGVFSKEIKSNHSDYFKGHIHSIKINGESNNVIGTYINVPVSANDIPEGECTFKCRVKEEVRITPSQVSFSLSPKTLRGKNRSDLQPGSFGAEPVVIKQSDNSAEVKKIKTRLRLENNQFIGQFSPERTEGWYKITDIRNTDFTKIEDKERGVKDLTIFFSSPKKFNRYAYYRFTWVLLESDPLKFGIDKREDIVPVYPKDIVRCLHDSIIHYHASAAKKITRTLDTLNKQLTQSGKEVFIYELLQNANDYPKKQRVDGKVTPVPVDVEFHITSNFLTFQHTGEYFNLLLSDKIGI